MLKLRDILFPIHAWPNTAELNVASNGKVMGVWSTGYDHYLSVLESTEDSKINRKFTTVRTNQHSKEIPQNGQYVGNMRDANGYFYHVIEVMDQKEEVAPKK